MPADLFDGVQDRILEAATYGVFKKTLAESGCKRCALHRSRTRIVVDRGNPAARVILVGEAPGENEDLQGRAFVGRSGRLLDEMMKEIGFDTEADGLIVNVVKCRPPDNRAPKQEEADACRPFLQKQLALVKPEVVLLLGATALKHLIKPKAGFSMKEETGRFFTDGAFPGQKLMVLYHPAYILRDPRKRPVMAGHLRIFKTAWKPANNRGGS